MNKRLLKYIMLCMVVFLTNSLFAEVKNEAFTPVDEIAKCIKDGDAAALAKYFNTTVEIVLPGTDGAYSKAQAQMIFKNYFAKSAPDSFSIKQKGKSSGNSEFFIGIYKAKTETYSVYVLLKPENGELLIQQIHFEEEK